MKSTFQRLVATAACLGGLAACAHAPGSATAELAGGFDALAAAKGGGVSLIVLPDEGNAGLLAGIRAARKSIKMEMYLLTASKTAGEVLQAMIERRKAGLNVEVMLETQPFMPPMPPKCQVGNFNPNTPAIQALMAGGVTVKYTSPRFKYTHAKSMVIDDQTAYIMSANMTHTAFTANRDYIIVDHNPADVADVNHIFDADWSGATYVPRSPNMVVSPVNSRSRLLALIDSAQRELVIQTEFFGDPEVASHLQARVKAGVDITVMCSYQSKDRCTGGDIDADEAKQLNAVGITKVAFIRSVKLHAKTIIADQARAYVGSENLSTNSLDNNREIGVLMTDPAVVGRLHDTAMKDWASRAVVGPDPGGNDPDSLVDLE